MEKLLDASNNYYNNRVDEITRQYLSLTFDQVHASWANDLETVVQKSDAAILDVGAGSGRDVKHIAEKFAEYRLENPDVAKPIIYAIEPAIEMIKVGQKVTQNLNIKWLQDSLPALTKTNKLAINFDLILVSAVWMHIAPTHRGRAMRKLANLLKPGGRIVISLKFGMSTQEQSKRSMHDVRIDEVKSIAKSLGLIVRNETSKEIDKLSREEVSWQTVILQLPDDGTGAFPFIRHVAINDGKSGTHKLALLRVLLRIADGHPGAVLRREKTLSGYKVILPMGLVALYWLYQYKDLIDEYGLFQTPNKKPNMGFMSADGWHSLNGQASDFRIGNLFLGDEAISLHKTISACARNIRDMPCKYIKQANTNRPMFEADIKRVTAISSLFLDIASLSKWGEFSLPETTWLAFSNYACWIEPVLVNEWVKTMASYSGNTQYSAQEKQHYLYRALNWLEPKRNTTFVRNKVESMRQKQAIQCTWSAKLLKNDFAVDHSLPFSRWPNNDLWNLLPSSVKANGQKADKLPSENKLFDAKERIMNWWDSAWLSNCEEDENQICKRRFFAEANTALPSLDLKNESVHDVFEALCSQRGRLRSLQQLQEWE